jgi:hypothetical protein
MKSLAIIIVVSALIVSNNSNARGMGHSFGFHSFSSSSHYKGSSTGVIHSHALHSIKSTQRKGTTSKAIPVAKIKKSKKA